MRAHLDACPVLTHNATMTSRHVVAININALRLMRHMRRGVGTLCLSVCVRVCARVCVWQITSWPEDGRPGRKQFRTVRFRQEGDVTSTSGCALDRPNRTTSSTRYFLGFPGRRHTMSYINCAERPSLHLVRHSSFLPTISCLFRWLLHT